MYRAILICVIALSGCASFPQWSDKPQDCSRWDENKERCLQCSQETTFKKIHCVEYPEVVIFPAYLELLKLPPAKENQS